MSEKLSLGQRTSDELQAKPEDLTPKEANEKPEPTYPENESKEGLPDIDPEVKLDDEPSE